MYVYVPAIVLSRFLWSHETDRVSSTDHGLSIASPSKQALSMASVVSFADGLLQRPLSVISGAAARTVGSGETEIRRGSCHLALESAPASTVLAEPKVTHNVSRERIRDNAIRTP